MYLCQYRQRQHRHDLYEAWQLLLQGLAHTNSPTAHMPRLHRLSHLRRWLRRDMHAHAPATPQTDGWRIRLPDRTHAIPRFESAQLALAMRPPGGGRP